MPHPTPAKAPANPPPDAGLIAAKTYTNKALGFAVTFPDEWLIPDGDFEAVMKKQGFDLSLKAPETLSPASQTRLNEAVQRVRILVTAYRSMPGSANNAIVRISVEDLVINPQIHDAVDYFDAVRAMYRTMKLPPDFVYSETQAEKLGAMQFGFLDTSSSAGKKRMYAIVRHGYALLFTLSYTNEADLRVFRSILEHGNFALK